MVCDSQSTYRFPGCRRSIFLHGRNRLYAFVRLDDGSYLFDARSHIEDVEEEMGVELPRGEYDTLGGFISHLLGHVPIQGEKSRYSDLLFTVQEADPRKVSLIKVSPITEGD